MMKLWVVAVGQKIPTWAQTACDDYAKRFTNNLKLQVKTVKTESRGSKSLQALYAAEKERILEAMPKNAYKVVLDERGEHLTTLRLAQRLKTWEMEHSNVVWVIGGPDGLDPQLKNDAHECLRLSDLTLPHALARVLLLEQLYRAWSINANHPYHRE